MSSTAKMVQKIMDNSVKPAHLLLIGRVGDAITAGGVEAALRQIKAQPLRITLHSEGGDFIEASRIYARLREHAEHQPVSITAIRAQSAGAWILTAADHRVIARNGEVLLHNVCDVSSGQSMTPGALRERAAALEGMAAIMGDILADRTGIARERIFELMENETTLNAAGAVSSGFAHEICDPIY